MTSGENIWYLAWMVDAQFLSEVKDAQDDVQLQHAGIETSEAFP